MLRIPKNTPCSGTPGFLGSGPHALSRILGAGCESAILVTSARTGRGGRVTGQEGCGPHPPSALSLPLSEALPLAREDLSPQLLSPKTQVKETGWVAFPYGAPPPSLLAPDSPPTHNEQLVENLHFMKIGLKNKGVSLYYTVLPSWPVWVLSPP